MEGTNPLPYMEVNGWNLSPPQIDLQRRREQEPPGQ